MGTGRLRDDPFGAEVLVPDVMLLNAGGTPRPLAKRVERLTPRSPPKVLRQIGGAIFVIGPTVVVLGDAPQN